MIENVEAEVQARPWKSGVEKDQKNDKISLTSEGCRRLWERRFDCNRSHKTIRILKGMKVIPKIKDR